MIAANETKPTHSAPEGFDVVASGRIKPGDMVWNDSSYQWESVTSQMINDDIDAYHAIARSNGKAV